MLIYVSHEGNVYTPKGKVDINVDEMNTKNKEVERQEIEWLKTAPYKVFLYVTMPTEQEIHDKIHNRVGSRSVDGSVAQCQGDKVAVCTWLGTSVATNVVVGPRRYSGFGWDTYRRWVTCRIFGVRYHGWYMASSGSYCRLTKAKNQ